jgi:hypothetical protein
MRTLFSFCKLCRPKYCKWMLICLLLNSARYSLAFEEEVNVAFIIPDSMKMKCPG